MGDKFNLTGDFRGAIVNVKSTLSNVQQSAGMIPGASEDERKQLQDLIGRLSAELEKAPPAQKEDAETVAITASTLIEQVKSGKPNRTLLQITGEGLKQAATNFYSSLPTVLPLVMQMVETVARLSGR